MKASIVSSRTRDRSERYSRAVLLLQHRHMSKEYARELWQREWWFDLKPLLDAHTKGQQLEQARKKVVQGQWSQEKVIGTYLHSHDTRNRLFHIILRAHKVRLKGRDPAHILLTKIIVAAEVSQYAISCRYLCYRVGDPLTSLHKISNVIRQDSLLSRQISQSGKDKRA